MSFTSAAKDIATRNRKIIEMHRGGCSAGLIVQFMPGVTLGMVNGVLGRAKRQGMLPASTQSTRKICEWAMGGVLKPRAPLRRVDENPTETVIPPDRVPTPPPARAPKVDENSTPTRISPSPAPAPAIAVIAPEPMPEPQAPSYTPSAEPATRGTCRYPIGEPRKPGFRFCDAPAQLGSSYCPTHHAVCWTRATKPKPIDLPLNYGVRHGRHAAR